MDAAEMSTIVDIQNEAQARELAPLRDDPEGMRKVWAEASGNGPLTAKAIHDVVERRMNGAHVGYATGESEWYTPAEYIAAAKAVMGDVDLDPATVPIANDVVGAATIYTLQEDGLTQPWAGRIWLNPPYAQPAVSEFCEKLARHYSEGDVTEACVMVNNATETRWFHTLIAIASAICFPLGRIKFWHPDRESAPLQGQAVIYIGPNATKFAAHFDGFGFTAVL
jgi:ParB family chromosome partitioning protein